jgi:hypothetical protein
VHHDSLTSILFFQENFGCCDSKVNLIFLKDINWSLKELPEVAIIFSFPFKK